MLPKPEKNKKVATDESTPSISPQEKIAQKRRLLIIIIFLTIGLSFIFSTYSFLKTFHFTPPTISAPDISLGLTTPESKLKSLLKSDYQNWTFTLQTNNSDNFWSSSPDVKPIDFPSVSALIEQQNQSLSPMVTQSIPSGLKIFQLIETNRCQLVVLTPEDQVYIDIQSPANHLDLTSRLPDIIPVMYWSSQQN